MCILTAVREAMRDLSVDSNMIGQVVHVVGSVDGRLESGAVVPVTDDLPLTLVRRQHILRYIASRNTTSAAPNLNLTESTIFPM